MDLVEQTKLQDFAEKAYLNYSMYVILDRALPHIADGLKPVQRRIVYAMSELSLHAMAKFKKSARTIGDVLGKYHPHSDVACYEAMVLMAQSFSYRYPLIDGQGNWGSADDPKSFAAMRYTEARLTAYADRLLSEVNQGTVHWQANFDGSLEEPCLLPAQIPNLLLNGSTGIAVGMATDIPPHNLGEVIAACRLLLRNNEASLEEVCSYMPSPDYPTAAEIITPREDLLEMYRRGYGTVRQRAVYTVEDNEIIIEALPYQVSGAKILEQIAEQMNTKKMNLLADLRDESDYENPTRLVLVPRSSRADISSLMSHLFVTTDLEKSYRVSFNVIGLDGRPQVKDLLTLLHEWLTFRREVITKRTQYRLVQVTSRLHLLEGFLITYLNLDGVIMLIREQDEPLPVLMQMFALTKIQAEAILDRKLRHLARLEEISIRQEQATLLKEYDGLSKILGSTEILDRVLDTELAEIEETMVDPRRSILVARDEATVLKEDPRLLSEWVTVILSKKGWIRAAKGQDIDPSQLSYKAGDVFLTSCLGRTHHWVSFLDSTGRCYGLFAHQLPPARGQGEPLTSFFAPPIGTDFQSMSMHDLQSTQSTPQQALLMASDSGYGFIAATDALVVKHRSGKALITLPPGAHVLPFYRFQPHPELRIAAVSYRGHLLIFLANTLPQLAKGKGNKMLHIDASNLLNREDYLLDFVSILPEQSLIIHTLHKQWVLSPKDCQSFWGERGKRGKPLPRGFKHVHRLEVKG